MWGPAYDPTCMKGHKKTYKTLNSVSFCGAPSPAGITASATATAGQVDMPRIDWSAQPKGVLLRGA